MAAPVVSSAGPTQAAEGARLSLALLLGINLFNYIDRQVLSAVLPKLELDADLFKPDDPWLKFKLGWLTTAFMVSYMVMSPVFGRLGDTRPRWLLVGVGVILWSLASGGSGLATGFAVLLLTRCLVGIGEAAYGPVAPAMLADLYPVSVRGKIMAWFYLAIPVGSALGFVLGGQVAETALGWRGAFLVVVLPGLVLGAACFLMREPRRFVSTSESERPSWMRVMGELRQVRSFVLCCAGMTCTTFVLGGVAAWTPYYIFEREARFQVTEKSIADLDALRTTKDTRVIPEGVVEKLRPLVGPETLDTRQLKEKLKSSALTPEENQQYQSRVFKATTMEGSITLGQVGLYFGAIVVVSGLGATLLGGWLGDRLRSRVRGAYFLVCGLGAIVAFVPFVAMLYTPFPAAWGCVFVSVFFLFLNTGPANTILANVTRRRIRASAFAINILIIHALGDAISPPLIGLMAGYTEMGTALLAASLLIPVAGVLWIVGAKYLDEDTRHVEEADAAS